jgi:predicted nucleotidyltransferase
LSPSLTSPGFAVFSACKFRIFSVLFTVETARAFDGTRDDIIMTTHEQIQEVAWRIGREFRPQRVILFGSYARGKPTPDSDVDLLVITPVEKRTADKAVEILLRVRPPFPIDLLVRTPQQVQERLELGDVFMREVLEQGQVLYEADHARMGGES